MPRGWHCCAKLIDVWIITAEDSDIVRRRCEKLQIADVWLGVANKAPLVQQLLRERGIDAHNVAYIGDDVNDLECLRLVGLSACPADAQPEVRAEAQWQSSFAGGHGAVRELCSYILNHLSRMLKQHPAATKAPGATCSRHFPRLFSGDSYIRGAHPWGPSAGRFSTPC